MIDTESLTPETAIGEAVGERRVVLAMPGFSGGGAERVMINLARALLSDGLAVEFLVLRRTGAFADEIPPGAILTVLGVCHARQGLPAMMRYLRRSPAPMAMFTNLPPMNVLVVAAATLTGFRAPIIPVLHNTFSVQFERLRWWRRLFMKLSLAIVLRRCPRIVAVSEGVKEDTAQQTGIPLDRISVIYNPVYDSRILEAAREPFEHPWLAPNRRIPVVCAVGRLTLQKDFQSLLEAMAILTKSRPARLLILGEGPERSRLEKLRERLKLEDSVELLGFLKNPHACVAKCDGLVMSSLWEGFGNVLVEAMAVGIPVASTRCPSGPDEILDDGKWGYLCEPKSPIRLAETIAMLIDSPRPIPPTAELEKYSISCISGQYAAVINHVHSD